ncbi:mitochondrial distribution and morphology protein 34 [Parathielavia appendiculata]|uniref:Mitochondrial distribution and morphology protein 34 n=1 Tax=Parathielavia appendiculata TaxID=2587402 RepID=A0AAN6U186_9PEZI|nr:mitochondrial distribution and morphology protein 34 [Parathielavia appendiculata]
MAFNFNWSPLTADAGFYKRARDLLTTALNKSPKPPIIVDDIIVTEFNLGSVPPDLEILEIGDLAEDRFRGIFKMCYSGDAFLTLKTRVQANPLNTYLSAKPSFTSPQPLAAASSLTIPLQITLSEIKLSAFIILVFSKQKGLTIVFRNDPLESLKVSSTFDSIQFVRDYLQRTIEGKLRDLMMDELPAIIHRLSLQLWCPDQIVKEDEEPKEADEHGVNPLATPPQDPVDLHGHVLDPAAISELSLDGGPEAQLLFSQKTLLRLSDITNAQVTSSLDTSAPKDVLFRAWAGPDKVDATNTPPLSTPNLVRSSSYASAHTYTFSDGGSQDHGSLPSRPSMVHLNSATAGLSLGAGRHSKAGRKKKTRVVNLRRKAETEVNSEQGDESSEIASTAPPMSEPVMPHPILEVPEEEPVSSRVRFSRSSDLQQPRRSSMREPSKNTDVPIPSVPINGIAPASQPTVQSSEKQAITSPAPIADAIPTDSKAEWRRSRPMSDTSSVILEQAWIMKMAGEIARRVYDEKNRNPSFWDDRDDAPPPAYEAR